MKKIFQYKKTLHFVFALLCVIGMGFLAQWAWKIQQAPKVDTLSLQRPEQNKTHKTIPTRVVNHDLRDILSAHLFKQNTKKNVAAIIQKKIPKTSQSLFLHGLINSSNPKNSIALIAHKKNKAPLPYQQGDKLPNNSGKIDLILNTYVQIKRNGRLEKLELLQNKNAKALPKNAVKRSPAFLKISNLADIKSNYTKNKSDLLSQFGLVQSDGGIKLTTKKGKLPPGLRENDVITSINGYSLYDFDNNLELLDNILNSNKIEASLNRNGRTIHFNIPKKMIQQWK